MCIIDIMRLTKQSPEFKSLKMKYFWQQKATEFSWFISILVMLFYIPYYLGLLIIKTMIRYGLLDKVCYYIGGEAEKVSACISNIGPFITFDYWMMGFLGLLFSAAILILLVGVFTNLIRSNLDKAEKRASEELGLK